MTTASNDQHSVRHDHRTNVVDLPFTHDQAVTFLEQKVWRNLEEARNDLSDALVLTDPDRLIAACRRVFSVGALCMETARKLEGRQT